LSEDQEDGQTTQANPAAQTMAWKRALKTVKRRSLKSWLLVSLFQALAYMPHRARQSLGALLGRAMPWLAPGRARIVAINLALCFPDRSTQEREQLAGEHFRALAQTFIDRGVLWFGDAPKIRALVRLKGFEHLQASLEQGHRVMLLAPHWVGLDAAATRLTLEGPEGGTLYSPQADKDIDALVRLGRGRFHQVHLVSRREGLRGLVRLIQKHIPIYYLPDMDFGQRGAVFVPFFGVAAATQTATAELARQYQLAVLPVMSHWDLSTGRYQVEILPALVDFPGQRSAFEATRDLNECLQSWIEDRPAQYYWVHRRFKTRPHGQPSPYQP
jgi:KDO2-lipid IV(A) lauroyltransferase